MAPHLRIAEVKVSKGKGLKYWKEEKCQCLFTVKCVKKYKQGTYYEDMECETWLKFHVQRSNLSKHGADVVPGHK